MFFFASGLVVAFQVVQVRAVGTLAVTMVCLVVQNENVLHAHQARHHPLQHLPLGLHGNEVGTAALQQGAGTLGELHSLAQLEAMEIGNDDLGPVEIAQHVAGDNLAASVVAVRVVGLEHPQAVANGDPRRDDQEPAGKQPAVRMAHGIDRLPGDQHGHHRRLARAGGEFQRGPEQRRVGLLVGTLQVLQEPGAAPARLGCDLGEPDRGFDGLDLAVERADVVKAVVAPVLQQPRGLGRDLPLIGGRQVSPRLHVGADFIDDGRRVVFLLFCRKTIAGSKHKFRLVPGLSAPLRFWNRRDQFRAAAKLGYPVGRLAIGVQLPMPAGIGVGRVEDRVVEECVAHARRLLGSADLLSIQASISLFR